MNATIIKNMFSPLKKGDMFFFLGDLSWSKDGYWQIFNNLPDGVEFHWILGNHDLKEWKQWRSHVTSTSELRHINVQKNTVALCHYPMLTWNKSHYNSFQLYGHHHEAGYGSDRLQDMISGKQLNVNCEFHDYKPWHEDEIIEYMNKRGDNWDRIIK